MPPEDLYTTPQIEARDDGLCPTKLPDNFSGSLSNSKDCVISFQTNSQLLNRKVREESDTSAELEFICESLSKCILENVDEVEKKSALISLDFKIEGCIWTMDLNPSLCTDGLQIQVTLLARNDEQKGTIWATETSLVYVNGENVVVAKEEAQKYPTSRAALEQTALVIRKAVLKCEFPEFPEGGKGRRFKQVYKLNAKVRTLEKPTFTRLKILLSQLR